MNWNAIIPIALGLAALAYFGFQWWKKKNPTKAAAVETKVENTIDTSHVLQVLQAHSDGIAKVLQAVGASAAIATAGPTGATGAAAPASAATPGATGAAAPAPAPAQPAPAAPAPAPAPKPFDTKDYGYPTGAPGRSGITRAKWIEAGSPAVDVNGYQLDPTGWPTGYMADGTTPIPGGVWDTLPQPFNLDAWLAGTTAFKVALSQGQVAPLAFTFPAGTRQLIKGNEHGFITEQLVVGGVTYKLGEAIHADAPTPAVLNVSLTDPTKTGDANYTWSGA
jgi:hypothetical protein